MDNYWTGMTHDPAVKKVNDLMARGISRQEAEKMVNAPTGASSGMTNSRLGPWLSWFGDQSENDLTQDPAINRVDDLVDRGIYRQDAERMVNVPVEFSGQPEYYPALTELLQKRVQPVPDAPPATPVAAPATLDVSPVQATAPQGSGSALGQLLARRARLNRDQGGELGQVTSGSNLAGLAHLFNSYVRGKDDRKRSAELESVEREVYAKQAEEKRREEARREALARQQWAGEGRGDL